MVLVLTLKSYLIGATNNAVIGTFFASLRFGVASPLYPKTPLHKNAPYSGVISANKVPEKARRGSSYIDGQILRHPP